MATENKRYYWLKFQEDFFSSLRVKKLRKLGSDYLIIYLKMQLFSLRNNGYLEFRGIEDTFAQELALELDEDADKVQLTLSFLQSCNLLEVRNDEFFLPYVEINTGSETASTKRSRECRASKGVAMQHDCNKNATLEIRDKNIDIKKSISTNVDIPKENSFSFDKHTNKENLLYILDNDSKYDKLTPDFKQALIDWCEYKDERKPKKNNHYTEKGLNMWITQTINSAMNHGANPVINQIHKAIANQWQGTNYDMLNKGVNGNGRY